ncbi:MAG: PAS domain S-box protein [Methanomassiliicoccales archaeon]
MISVLCVDSDPGRLGELVDFLRSSDDLLVRSSLHPSEAIEMARNEHFDAIVSEYDLNGMNGIQLLTSLREFDDAVFILFTSEERQEVAIEVVMSNTTLFVCRGRCKADRVPILLARLRHALRMQKEEEAHRKQEGLLRSIIEAAPDVILAIDQDLKILDVYRSVTRSQNYVGSNLLDYVDSEFRELVSQKLEWLFRTGEQVIWTSSGGKDPKAKGWYESNASPLREGGRVVGAVVVSRNINKRKAAEDKLIESEAKFHSLFDNSLDAMLLTRPDGSILMANTAACEMLEMTEEEILSRGRDGLLIRDELLETALEERKRNGRVRSELNFLKKDGSVLTGETTSNVFKAADGTLMTSIIVRNTTERKEREEALKLAHRQLSLLNQVTRHDMINQISIMAGYITLLESTDLKPNQTAHLRKLKASVDMLKRQVEFTRQYQEIGMEPPRWLRLSELVNKAAGSLDLKGLAVIGPNNDVCIEADPMLEKVVYNLIENVVRHGMGASKVVISVREGENMTVVAFQDDGPGIEDVDRTHLFEPGYGKNTGFGLFMSREILRMTGLDIMETGRQGSGARFEIVVPASNVRKD